MEDTTQKKRRAIDHIYKTTSYVHDMDQVFPRNEGGQGVKHLGDVMTCPHRLCVRAREIVADLEDVYEKAWRYDELCC
jgi:hypothetical protein